MTSMLRIFLDSNIIIAALLGTNKAARKLFFSPEFGKFTNEYAVKEIKRVLVRNFHFSHPDVEQSELTIRRVCSVMKNPPFEKASEIRIRDKSDAIIVYSAKRLGCVLISLDHKLLEDAKKFVTAKNPQELVK